MITQVCAIKDRALEAYAQPFHTQTLAQAIRSFSDEINRNTGDNPLHTHPEDYDLYHLGQYDNLTGKFDNIPTAPIQIASGKNCHYQGA